MTEREAYESTLAQIEAIQTDARAPLQAELQELITLLRWIWDEDEMGYIVDANGVKTCGQCNSTMTPEGGMTHEAYCLQGRIQPILDRHKKPQ